MLLKMLLFLIVFKFIYPCLGQKRFMNFSYYNFFVHTKCM